MHWKN